MYNSFSLPLSHNFYVGIVIMLISHNIHLPVLFAVAIMNVQTLIDNFLMCYAVIYAKSNVCIM
jgi:hypothetical protein